MTDEMVLATTLVGTRRWSGHALRLWRGAGVNTVRLYTAGATLDAKLGTRAAPIEPLAQQTFAK